MFKVNNKDTRTSSHVVTPVSSVSIVDFEQVTISGEGTTESILTNSPYSGAQSLL